MRLHPGAELKHIIDPNREGMSRRRWLCRCANGFGGLALATMLAEALAAESSSSVDRRSHPLAAQPPHFSARAKSVIFCFMDGGPSQVDTFDPKPRLLAENLQPIQMETPTTVFNISNRILASPFEFQRYGDSGAEVSELFPEVATCVDELTIIRSMVADHSEHTAANYFMHTGTGLQGRPSMGSWITYGLGSVCENLPGFIVLDNGLIPPGGLDVFGSGFLPASYQATLFRRGEHPVADLEPREPAPELQRSKLDLLRDLSKGVLDRFGEISELEATVANYELAFRMQGEVPDLLDFSGESETIREMYGLDEPDSREFGRSCLVARRLVQRGVRFVELLTPARGVDRWDQHYGLEEGHRINSRAVDRPLAALIKDLKGLGMLDETMVIWGGEFGRTPTAQIPDEGIDKAGRDHNPFGFTMWVAGGGFKKGLIYGATDEYGYYAMENKVHIHDLHATILHLLGLNHKKLTFKFGGREMRLTDVHGRVVEDLIA